MADKQVTDIERLLSTHMDSITALHNRIQLLDERMFTVQQQLFSAEKNLRTALHKLGLSWEAGD